MKYGKIVILMVLILLCGTMGFLNLRSWEKKPDEEATPSPAKTPAVSEEEKEDDLFATLRLQRRQNREEEIAMLKEILNHENESREGAELVSKRIAEITEYYEQEREMEQQLILHGYAEAFSFVQEDLVTIAVKGEVNGNENAYITKLAISVTGQKQTSIRILPIE